MLDRGSRNRLSRPIGDATVAFWADTSGTVDEFAAEAAEALFFETLEPADIKDDVTPAEHIRMVICEYGNVPPSSVPVVHRLANEGL